MILLITSTGFTSAYAGHGSSGGGGGCGSSCTPPTLGVDNEGNVRVDRGLSINGVSFEVKLYSQNIPAQIINEDEKTTITLRIFENEGPETVIHSELHFAPYEEVINGVLVERSLASLVWDNKFGDEIIGINDDENILQNVVIDAKNENDLKIISFEFESVMELDKTTLMTIIWDERRNPIKNYFIDAIKVVNPDNIELSQDNKTHTKIPSWIKNNAGWWAEGNISQSEFIQGLQYLIKNQILVVSTMTDSSEQSSSIPQWVKNTSKWWGDDLISDGEFVRCIQFLINNGIISA